MQAGATPDIRDDHGKAPIRVAAEMGHKEVVSQLAHSALGTTGMVPLDAVNEEYGEEEDDDEEFDDGSELSDGEEYSDGGEGGSTAGSSSDKGSEEARGPSRMDQQGAAGGSGQQAQQGSDDAPARAAELQRISVGLNSDFAGRHA